MFRRRAKGPDGKGDPAPSGEARREGSAAAAEPFTYVQRGTTIVGHVEAEGRVRVHGVVRGDMVVDGTLEVAEAGLVEGTTVRANDVKIIGRVVVDRLEARGKVEIWEGGELIGDVKAAALDIEEGARFTGRSEMTPPGGVAGQLEGPDAGAPLLGEPRAQAAAAERVSEPEAAPLATATDRS